MVSSKWIGLVALRWILVLFSIFSSEAVVKLSVVVALVDLSDVFPVSYFCIESV